MTRRATGVATLLVAGWLAPALAQPPDHLGAHLSPAALGALRARLGAPALTALADAHGRLVQLAGLRAAAPGRTPADRALGFVRDHLELLVDRPARVELTVAAVAGVGGASYVRLRGRAFGLPLRHGEIVVRLDGGAVTLVNGRLPALGRAAPAAPRIDVGDAARTARDETGWEGARIDLSLALEPVGGALRPVYEARIVDLAHGRATLLLVDAVTGAALGREPLLREVGAADVYATSPLGGELARVALGGLGGGETLQGDDSDVRACMAAGPDGLGCALGRRALADAGGDFIYAPDEGSAEDAFAEVMAYYHVGLAARFYAELGAPAAAAPLQVVTNFRVDGDGDGRLDSWDNAAFGPGVLDGADVLLLGQGPTLDFAYDGAVIAHEYGHAAASRHVLWTLGLDELGVRYQPAALGEGMADYFAASLEGTPSLYTYSAARARDPGRGRDLAAGASCPDGLVGEAHADGVIWGGFAWELHERLGAGDADKLIWETVMALDEAADLGRAGATAVALAKERLGARSAIVAEAAAARGLESCSRVLRLMPGEPVDGHLFAGAMLGRVNLDVGKRDFFTPGGLQYRVVVPDGTRTLAVAFSAFDRAGGGAPASLYARHGEPVAFNAQVTPTGLWMITEAEADVPSGDTLVLTASDDGVATLRPGTYFLAVVNRSPDVASFRLEATFDDQPDGLTPTAEPRGRGVAPAEVGCAAAGGGADGTSALALAAALAAARRRPGRRRPR